MSAFPPRNLVRSSVALVALIGVASLSACSGSAAPTPSGSRSSDQPPAFNASWVPCNGKDGWQCNRINVPWDYENPDGGSGQIELTVVRHPAQDPSQRIGTLFWNPGGPGSASVDSISEKTFSKPVLDRFDIVTFTPRGTAVSKLSCPDGTGFTVTERNGQLPSILDKADTQKWFDAMSAANKACAAAMGPKVALVGTWQTVADMDTIRAALGEDKISYEGYSYGGRLGAVYANRFGEHLRALVLDSPGNTDGNIQKFAIGKGEAFGNRFKALDLYCTKKASQKNCGMPDEPTNVYDETLVKLLDGKLALTPAMTPDKFVSLMIGSMGQTTDEPMQAAADALKAATSGNAQPLVALNADTAGASLPTNAVEAQTPTPSETLDVDTNYRTTDALVSINCADSEVRPDLAGVNETTIQIADSNPETALQAGSFAGMCAEWPMGSHPIMDAPATLSVQALMVKALGDPLVSPSEADADAAALKNATVIAWNGFKHGVAGTDSAPCIDKAVDAYLLNPAAPIDAKACGV